MLLAAAWLPAAAWVQQPRPEALVEQAARMALKLAHRGYVMETGRITLTDKAEAMLGNKRVQDAYLGE